MNKDYFSKTFIKICKNLKSNNIVICPDKVIGSNDECSIINVAHNVYTGVAYDCHISIDNLVLIDTKLKENPNINILDGIYGLSKSYPSREIIDRYNRMMTYTSYTPVSIYIDNLKENLNFNDIISHKASDGAFPFKITKEDIIYIYPQLISINKPDKVSLLFYKLPNFNIADFRIDKKFCIIDRYIGYLGI